LTATVTPSKTTSTNLRHVFIIEVSNPAAHQLPSSQVDATPTSGMVSPFRQKFWKLIVVKAAK
jgi:hypothetical protein